MTEPVLVYIPKENVNDDTVTLLEWLAPNGSAVKHEQPLAVIETSKVTFDFPSPAEGIIQYRHAERSEIEVGGLLCIISEDGKARFPGEVSPGAPPTPFAAPSPQNAESALQSAAPESSAAPSIALSSALPSIPSLPSSSPPPSPPLPSVPAPSQTRFSTGARDLLEREGLDPALFQGRGLVRSRDIHHFLGRGAANSPATSASAQSPDDLLKTLSRGIPFHSQNISRSKRLEIKHLSAGMAHTIPSLVSATLLTRSLRAAAAAEEVNPSAILIFETARLLRAFPRFNAFCANGQIHSYDEVNIGFAVDVDNGLKVPVVRRANEKSLREIAGELDDLLAAYINDALSLESLAGATFTITDLSGEGVFLFHPLIDLGQSAILGVGAEFFPPGSAEGMFNLMLAFDHQTAEGRAAAQFLAALAERLRGYEKAMLPSALADAPALSANTSSEAPGASKSEEPYCHSCERTLAEIHELHAHLLHEIGPNSQPLLICSLCLRGF